MKTSIIYTDLIPLKNKILRDKIFLVHVIKAYRGGRLHVHLFWFLISH